MGTQEREEGEEVKNKCVLAIIMVLVGGSAVAQDVTPRQRREIQLRRYSAYNRRFRMEVEQQQRMAQLQMFDAMSARRPPSPSVNTAGPTIAPQRPKTGRADPNLRDDVSGPYGFQGAPGRVPYSRNYRTGETIPTRMIPQGQGRLYNSISPR